MHNSNKPRQKRASVRRSDEVVQAQECLALQQRCSASPIARGAGVAALNLESAIDTALKRRLATHIVFAAPEEDERARLWDRQVHTGTAPIAKDVDCEALARAFPNMSGANIRNAAIAAAFLAAGDGAPRITQDYLVRAARAEYRSMGHLISEMITSRSDRRRSV